jgi:ankyrin repeat protein
MEYAIASGIDYGERQECVTTDSARNRTDVNEQSILGTLSEGKVKSALLLIQHGADVNAMGKDNKTALHLASAEGCAEIVRLLIQRGADVNTQDWELRTPLCLALARVRSKSV